MSEAESFFLIFSCKEMSDAVHKHKFIRQYKQHHVALINESKHKPKHSNKSKKSHLISQDMRSASLADVSTVGSLHSSRGSGRSRRGSLRDDLDKASPRRSRRSSLSNDFTKCLSAKLPAPDILLGELQTIEKLIVDPAPVKSPKILSNESKPSTYSSSTTDLESDPSDMEIIGLEWEPDLCNRLKD